MIDKQIIEDLRKRSGIAKMEFYKRIEMTSSGYDRMFANDSMKISTLEKIAEIFRVPITYFFEKAKPKTDTVPELQAKVTELYEENRQLMKENKKLMEQVAAIKESKGVRDSLPTGKLESK